MFIIKQRGGTKDSLPAHISFEVNFLANLTMLIFNFTQFNFSKTLALFPQQIVSMVMSFLT